MKNKKLKNINEVLPILHLPGILKDDCSTNKEVQEIVNIFESANSVEEQVTILHSFYSYLNTPSGENVGLILRILSNLFVNASPKSPVKKSILRTFTNATALHSEISLELSRELLHLINSTIALSSNYQRFNDCVNAISDCFNNCAPAATAVKYIVAQVFGRLMQFLKLLVDSLSGVSSPVLLQEMCLYIHNTTRALVAVCQQCDIEPLIPQYIDNICKYTIEILNHPDILFDSKNNCGILLIITVNYSKNGDYISLLQISSRQNVEKWGISGNDLKDDIALTCVYSGILNVVKPDQLCKYSRDFQNSNLYIMCEKLFDISKSSADKPSVVLGVNRALLLATKTLKPLNQEDLMKILNNFMDHVWTQLDHYVDTVRHVSKSILVNLIKLAMVHKEQGTNLPLDTIVDSVLNAPLHRNSRYVALSAAANEIGCEILLNKEPNLVVQLLEQSQDLSVSSYVISCYENLMRCHLRETEEKLWLNLWVLPLTTQLGEDEELDRKGSCLQKLLIIAIKIRPNILDTLLSQWSTDNEVQFSSLLKCALIARQIGVSVKEDSNKWRGLLHSSILDLAMCHQNDEIRVASIFLVAESHKSTEIFNDWELKFIVSFLHFNINTQLPSTRQQILFLIKKILARFSESYYSILRNYNKLNEKGEKLNTSLLKHQKDAYENFVFELRDCIFDHLFPGANFSRRLICLEVLKLMEPVVEEVLKCRELTVDQIWIQSEADALILCLGDSYESNKILATKLLEKCPVTLLKLHDVENTKRFLNNALKYAASVKPADTVTAAYMLQTLMYSPILQGVLLNILELKSSEDNYINDFLLIKILFEKLQKQVEVGKENLLKAASSAPIHGTLFCLRHLMEKYLRESNLVETHWKKIVAEMIELCFDVSHVVGPVVNNSSPEGHLPMDHGTLNEDEDGTVTAQMLLVCSWRSVKEVSLLLGEITLKSTVATEGDNGLITEEQMLKIGEHFTVLLTETKHRGAFEQAYVGFSKLCTRLWQCRSPVLHQLPVGWLHNIFSAISGDTSSHNKLCATRRSAGVPFMIQAIVTSELQTGGSSNFHWCMSTLLQLANDSGDNIEVRTHAMNILRTLYRHTQLGEVIAQYVAQGVIAAVGGFAKNTWAERNSATLLFASLMTRIFGVQRTKDTEHLSVRNRMTARVFFLRYPTLHAFLLKQLQHLTDTCVEPHEEFALYPILLLLARLYPASNDENEVDRQLEDFVPYMKKCANNRTLKIREVAAKTLVPLVPTHEKNELLKELFAVLKHKDHNKRYIHGVLLQILQMIPSASDNKHLNIASIIKRTHWIMIQNSVYSCAITAAFYMQVLIALTTKYKFSSANQRVVVEALISVLKHQDDIVQKKCIVGKTLYQRTATNLHLHLLVKSAESLPEKCSSIFEVLNTYLTHKSEDERDFILNFLICLLKNSDTAVLVNEIDIPQEEQSLIKLFPEDLRRELLQFLALNQDRLVANLKGVLDVEKRNGKERMNNHNTLSNKALFVLSNYERAVLDLGSENGQDPVLCFTREIDETDDYLPSFILCCIRTLLRHYRGKRYEMYQQLMKKNKELVDLLRECSSPENDMSCRYFVALILLENEEFLYGQYEIKTEHLMTLWTTVMKLLGDTEPVVRNTISKLCKMSPIAEKCKEELLKICVSTLKEIDEKSCISLLITWAVSDAEDDEDLEVQIFDSSEDSTYVEDICLSKMSAKMIPQVMNIDKNDALLVLKYMLNILTTDEFCGSKGKVLSSVLEEISSKTVGTNCKMSDILEQYFSESDVENCWNILNVTSKFKILNIVTNLVPFCMN